MKTTTRLTQRVAMTLLTGTLVGAACVDPMTPAQQKALAMALCDAVRASGGTVPPECLPFQQVRAGQQVQAERCPASAQASYRTEVGFSMREARACATKPATTTVEGGAGPIEVIATQDSRGLFLEGDIRIHANQQPGPARTAARTKLAARWPGGRIPFFIDSAVVDDPANPDDLFSRVMNAVQQVNTFTTGAATYAGPITLVQVPGSPGNGCGPNDVNCVHFVSSDNCSSPVGMVGGAQRIELDPPDAGNPGLGLACTTDANCATGLICSGGACSGTECSTGSIVHEILHAAGMWHEQSAANRGAHIQVFEANILDDAKDNFKTYTALRNDGTDFTAYDYDSIMHYNAFSFGRPDPANPGAVLQTIRRTDGGPDAALGQRVAPSANDRAGIEAMYGNFAFSNSGELEGRNCVKVTEPAEPAEHGWSNNYFCANRPGVRWSNAGPIGAYQCVQISETADPHTWTDNYLCFPSTWRERFQWSSAGPIVGQRCIAFYEPADPDTWDDNYLCWVEAPPPEVPKMKQITLEFSGIDDDAFVWVGATPGDVSRSVCTARYANGQPGGATCDLTDLARRTGLSFDQRFVIKFGNGGGLNSCGTVRILADGVEQWKRSKSCVVRHTGWFYRAEVVVHFYGGTVRVDKELECRGIFDCPN